MLEKTVVLIPAYMPDERLPAYVRSLLSAGIGKVLVVDDGGGEKFDSIFNEIKAMENTDVIRYMPNHGKGYAMKTGMAFMRDHYQGMKMVVTADADGQHKTEDVLRMVEAQAQYGDGLLLGSRDFSQPDVPFKSRNGNRITSAVFHLLYGQKVVDTQTGLRAFGWDLLPMMIDVKGDRYEYEMKVLIECAVRKIPMRPLTIATVYENNNEGSHFHAVRDSARIYGILLGSFFKFMAGSLLSFCVDYVLFTLINWILEVNCPGLDGTIRIILPFVKRILIATAAARIGSGLFNYFYNRKVTFRSNRSGNSSMLRYLVVFVCCMILSAALVSGFHLLTKVDEKILKIPVDLLIFFLNYRVQALWVFKKKKPSGQESGKR